MKSRKYTGTQKALIVRKAQRGGFDFQGSSRSLIKKILYHIFITIASYTENINNTK